MEFGVTFPQTEIGTDPSSIQRYAGTVEELGYDHVLAYDHVLGVEPPRPDWDGAYDYTDQFLEPFVLFAHQAAVTTDLRFVTGVLVLPQRETPLVAKQAATLDVLSGGRFVLGAGVGWNEREYRNLDKEFRNRGARIEEQVSVLRELWQHALVDFDGEWHRIHGAGIDPRPIQRPIPVWMGGGADVVLRRIARLGDGWIAPSWPMPEFRSKLGTLRESLEGEGRDPDDFPVHVRLDPETLDDDAWLDHVGALDDLGVTHVAANTMGLGYETADEHLEVLEDVATDLGDAGFR